MKKKKRVLTPEEAKIKKINVFVLKKLLPEEEDELLIGYDDIGGLVGAKYGKMYQLMNGRTKIIDEDFLIILKAFEKHKDEPFYKEMLELHNKLYPENETNND